MGWDGHLRGLALLFGGVVFLTLDLKVCVCVCVSLQRASYLSRADGFRCGFFGVADL